jgi:hypothetical protein
MTNHKLLDFADEHAEDTNDDLMALDYSLNHEIIMLHIKLERDPRNNKIYRQIRDIAAKQRIIYLMLRQRLELFSQSSVEEIDN